jgi:hypothetical protein
MIPHRCGRCNARRALARRITHYVRPPKCLCGGTLFVDNYRLNGRDPSRRTCGCGAAPYPHRAGWCEKGHYHGEKFYEVTR